MGKIGGMVMFSLCNNSRHGFFTRQNAQEKNPSNKLAMSETIKNSDKGKQIKFDCNQTKKSV